MTKISIFAYNRSNLQIPELSDYICYEVVLVGVFIII